MFLRDVSSMMGTLYGEQNVPVEVMLPHDAMVLGRRMKKADMRLSRGISFRLGKRLK